VAFRELQAGRKTSHWIWYVFPQLAGLGRSSTAVYYGLAGGEEAADYLCDRVLGERLVAAAAAVRTHLADGKARAVRLEELMHVAKTLFAVDPQPKFAAMAEHAETILTAAAADGYGRCTYTEEHLHRLST
jgi:uncharacterized protein (DUF1810 family)